MFLWGQLGVFFFFFFFLLASIGHNYLRAHWMGRSIAMEVQQRIFFFTKSSSPRTQCCPRRPRGTLRCGASRPWTRRTWGDVSKTRQISVRFCPSVFRCQNHAQYRFFHHKRMKQVQFLRVGFRTIVKINDPSPKKSCNKKKIAKKKKKKKLAIIIIIPSQNLHARGRPGRRVRRSARAREHDEPARGKQRAREVRGEHRGAQVEREQLVGVRKEIGARKALHLKAAGGTHDGVGAWERFIFVAFYWIVSGRFIGLDTMTMVGEKLFFSRTRAGLGKVLLDGLCGDSK
jgi:hypothetical protein